MVAPAGSSRPRAASSYHYVMPVSRIVDSKNGEDDESSVEERIREALKKNIEHAVELRAQRARAAKGRTPAVSQSTSCKFEPGEDPEEHVRRAARDILDIIAIDAEGQPWKGEVAILGTPHANGKPNVLARVVKVHVNTDTSDDDDDVPRSREHELVSVIKECRVLVKDMGETVVKISNAKGLEHEAIAKLVESVAKVQAGESKWSYRMHAETEKTERVREEAHERAARSRHRWEAFESMAAEYKDVVELWSRFVTDPTRKSGSLPTRPTADEVRAVFDAPPDTKVDGRAWSDIFDPIRALVSEMIAEPDVKRRVALSREFREMVSALTKNARDAMVFRMASVLGESRAREVGAWLSLPVS